MEIHAPEGSVSSLKDFVVHLGIVTIGILIALSLEGIVEWRHHRALVAEARENIISELRDNQRELTWTLQRIPGTQKDQRQIIVFIQNALTHRKNDTKEVRFAFNRADLSDTSWVTAQTVGALGLMGYSETKKYAQVYQLQHVFSELQDKTVNTGVSAMGVFSESGDPSKLPAEELTLEKSRVLDSLSQLTAQQQIGQQLAKRYDEVLKER